MFIDPAYLLVLFVPKAVKLLLFSFRMLLNFIFSITKVIVIGKVLSCAASNPNCSVEFINLLEKLVSKIPDSLNNIKPTQTIS